MSAFRPSSTSFPTAYAEQNSSGTLYRVAVAFIILEIIFVGLRYYSRLLTKTKIGLDDILMVPALLTVVGLPALLIAMIHYGGAGRHTDYILATQPETYVTFNKIQYALVIDYPLAVTFPKLAIVAFLLRIFPQRSFRIACFVITGILVATVTANIVTCLVECIPLKALWDPSVPNAACLDISLFWRWASFSNIVTDIALLIVPIPFITQLNLSVGVKFGLVITFANGGLGVIASTLRFAAFWKLGQLTDILYVCGTTGIYTTVESGSYLIAACLLALRGLPHILSEGVFQKVSTLIQNIPWSWSTTTRNSGRSKTSQTLGPSWIGKERSQSEGDTLPLTSLDLRPDLCHGNFANARRSDSVATSTNQDRSNAPDKIGPRMQKNAITVSHKIDVTHSK